MLSDSMKQFITDEGLSFPTQTRLVPNFYDKKRYPVHITTLQYYLKLGLKIEKVHRAISFEQTEWLQSYIDLTSRL